MTTRPEKMTELARLSEDLAGMANDLNDAASQWDDAEGKEERDDVVAQVREHWTEITECFAEMRKYKV